MIKNARGVIERERLHEMRAKGKEGSKEWFRYLRGDNINDKIDEILVNGKRIQERTEIVRKVKVFWENIGGMNEDVQMQRDIDFRITMRDLHEIDSVIDKHEVEEVLKHLKYGKAAGIDDVPYEMFKNGGETVVGMLLKLYNKVWSEEKVPCNWNESRVVLLHKGGHKSKKELKNYRPIALMDTIGKIFCMVLNERLRVCVERNRILSDEQNGFRRNRRGEDNIFIVRELIERCKQRNERGYFAFLDIEKAYDRVNREILCKVLSKCGMSGKIVRIIRSMYVNTRAKYMLGDIESEWVQSKRGVRQGCILSPVLFALYTEELALRVKSLGVGMKVGMERLSILMYADDIIIMSESSDELQELLDIVNEYSRDFCVNFGADKSQVMVINGEQERNNEWKLGSVNIKRTSEYKYLGVTLSENDADKAKGEMLFRANQWYGRLASVARYRSNKYVTVKELWKAISVPSITYGMNVLNWSECELQKLEVIQNKVGRVALGANRYTCVEAIRGDMGWSTFSERSMKGNIMYKVRIERMEDERWVKKIYKDVGRCSKWTNSCKRLVRKCGLSCRENVFGRGHVAGWNVVCINGEGYNWSLEKWRQVVNVQVKELAWRKWKNSMNTKSTLEWYREKDKPKCEIFYDGSWGSELLFKARSQSLEVNGRTYRWSADGGRLCNVCESREVESVSHVIVECERYEQERRIFIEHVNKEMNENVFGRWNEDEKDVMCLLLGIKGEMNVRIIEAVKKFLVNIWQKRKSGIPGNQVMVVNDHQYVRRVE